MHLQYNIVGYYLYNIKCSFFYKIIELQLVVVLFFCLFFYFYLVTSFFNYYQIVNLLFYSNRKYFLLVKNGNMKFCIVLKSTIAIY